MAIEGLGQASGRGAEYWDRRAAQFRRMSEQHDPSTDRLVQLLTAAVGNGGTFLDVGAGAGRYTIPLAAAASSVTAVEPSAAMREHLDDRVRLAGLRNVHVVPAAWEEATVEPHDVVLAAHVLYPIEDIVPFVEKIVTHARRCWFLAIRVEPMGGELAPLWEEVWSTPYPAEPVFLDLYNLLFSRGLRPHAELKPFAGTRTVAFEDAVAQAKSRLFLAEDDTRYDERIRSFLTAHMQGDGEQWRWPWRALEAVVYGDVA